MRDPQPNMAPSIKLRPARSGDYAYAERLYLEAMKPLLTELGAWDAAEVIANLKAHYKLDEVLVVSVDGRDAGWLQVSELEHEFDLAQIYLEPPFRSRGIGTRLVEDLLTRARKHGKPVALHVVRNNQAISLYQRLGFKVVGENETKLHMRWDRS